MSQNEMTREEMIETAKMNAMGAIYALRTALGNLEDLQKMVGEEKAVKDAIEKINGNELTGKVGAIEDIQKFVEELRSL